MRDYTLNEIRKVNEAYASILEANCSVHENPNIRLNVNDEIQTGLAENIDECSRRNNFILKYAEMLFKWYRNDVKSGDCTSQFLKAIYVTNFENIVDLLLEYEHNVKKLKSSGINDMRMDIFTDGSKMFSLNFDELARTSRRINGIHLIEFTNKRASRYTKTSDLEFDESDYSNVFLSNYDSRYVVFTTIGFESTNKFIYAIWKNKNMNTEYGEPAENSPYCTRVKQHWDTYSSASFTSPYKQYWFFLRPYGCEIHSTGNISEKEVQSVLYAISNSNSDGKHGLLCMNDSGGDILDYNDEKMQPSIKFTDEIQNNQEIRKSELQHLEKWEQYKEAKKKLDDLVNKGEVVTSNVDFIMRLPELKGIIEEIETRIYGHKMTSQQASTFVNKAISQLLSGIRNLNGGIKQDDLNRHISFIKEVLKLKDFDYQIKYFNEILNDGLEVYKNQFDLNLDLNNIKRESDRLFYSIQKKKAAELADSTEIFNWFEFS